jgi:phospholipase C
MLSYDETGGWGDHVTPYTSPNGTEGEWITDPYNTNFGLVPMGPGFRLPFYVVSPFTRGGNVFTEHADHNSQIMFVEKWLAAKGYNVTTEQMPEWRREHMSDLTKAFDFNNLSCNLLNPETQKRIRNST